jgi:hypothetical protein
MAMSFSKYMRDPPKETGGSQGEPSDSEAEASKEKKSLAKLTHFSGSVILAIIPHNYVLVRSAALVRMMAISAALVALLAVLSLSPSAAAATNAHSIQFHLDRSSAGGSRGSGGSR